MPSRRVVVDVVAGAAPANRPGVCATASSIAAPGVGCPSPSTTTPVSVALGTRRTEKSRSVRSWPAVKVTGVASLTTGVPGKYTGA